MNSSPTIARQRPIPAIMMTAKKGIITLIRMYQTNRSQQRKRGVYR